MPKNKTAFKKITKTFEKFSEKVSDVVGSPWWFVFSLMIILVWVPSRLFIKSAEIWHLIINTTTTILTFLMMALLHSSQRKWEDRIERLEQKETTELKFLKKHTKKIAYDSGKQIENEKSNENKEKSPPDGKEIKSIL